VSVFNTLLVEPLFVELEVGPALAIDFVDERSGNSVPLAMSGEVRCI